MAVVIQTVTAVPQIRPLTSALRTVEERNKSSEPFAQLVHMAEAVVLNGVDPGENARLRLEFPIPENYAVLIQQMFVTFFNVDTDNWHNPTLEMYVALGPETEAAATVQIDQGVNRQFTHGIALNTAAGRNFSYPDAAAINGSSPPIVFGYPGTSTHPTFEVDCVTDDSDAHTFSYYVRWLMFSLEQLNTTGLFWAIPTLNVQG